MKRTINLSNKEKSVIQFEISKFPDGQQSVTLKAFIPNDEHIEIVSRMNSFSDLELIICANAALKEMGVKNVHLFVPYFLGARSDRKFVEGGSNYLKDVICPIINMQNFESVTVLDPHSDVLEACLKNFKKESNSHFIKCALSKIDNKNGAQDRVVLVSPDAGAYKKIFDVAREFGISKVITATKVRDLKTGKILHTEIPTLDQHNDLKYVIIDDICDGGRTFIELAKAIQGSRPSAEIYLIVTHGIFSAGLYELSKHIKRIHSTNSVKDIEADSYSDFTVDKDFLIQYEVL